MKNVTVDDIDALLPQTQCGLCDYDGCKPYANAMINQSEQINRCPPGGIDVLKKLAQAFNIPEKPYLDDMLQKQKPAQAVVIQEEICIGCTKCIQACPVDAIMGAAKQMHTVIQDECTGCELCIEPCPVDCIDIITLVEPNEREKKLNADKYRLRYQDRNNRLSRIKQEKKNKHSTAKQTGNKDIIAARRMEIQAAIARVKSKREDNSEPTKT